MVEGAREISRVPLTRALIQLMKLHPHDLITPKDPTSYCQHLGVRIPTYEFGGDINIQAIRNIVQLSEVMCVGGWGKGIFGALYQEPSLGI